MKITISILAAILLISNTLIGQQCNTDEHSNHQNDTWTSCEKSANPNAARGTSHWIMYDLGKQYNLGATHFWNHNQAGETDRGVRVLAIDYSIDGINWTEASTVELQKASGNNQYQGESGPDLGNAQGRYVLLTLLETHGDECVGLSEFKLAIAPADTTTPVQDVLANDSGVEIFPNPTQGRFILRGELADYNIRVLDAVGRVHRSYSDVSSEVDIDISALPSGTYFIALTHMINQKIDVQLLIKQ